MELTQHKIEIIEKLNFERLEILSYGHTNAESLSRVEDIDRQISEIVSGDTFRSYELEFGVSVDDIETEAVDLDTGFGGNEYGFISKSFKNPDLDY